MMRMRSPIGVACDMCIGCWILEMLWLANRWAISIIERELDKALICRRAFCFKLESPSTNFTANSMDRWCAKAGGWSVDWKSKPRYERLWWPGNLGQIDEGEYQTVIRGHLLHYWSVIADDPAKSAATWTFRGARTRVGHIRIRWRLHQGWRWWWVRPSFDELVTNFDSCENYSGVERRIVD